MSVPFDLAPIVDASLSEQLARFVCNSTYRDLPADVAHISRLHFLDVIGIALASSRMDFGRVVCVAAERLSGTLTEDSPASFPIGSRVRLNQTSAALANGTMMHGLDFDDTHVGGVYHASAPAAAAALAVAQSSGASIEEMLLAYTLAVEVGCRLALAAPGEFHSAGFHPTSIFGTFAACCAAAKLRRTPSAGLEHALGLCGSMAAGLRETSGSWMKRMHPGSAASAGLTAHELGAAGFTGPRTVFEGRFGLYATHVGHPPEARRAALGGGWEFPLVAVKLFPCCHLLHAFIDAVEEIRVGGFNPVDIVEITAIVTEGPTYDVLYRTPERQRPDNPYDAMFSLPFVVATALTGHAITLDTFYDAPLDDPVVQELIGKTTYRADRESKFPQAFPGGVQIRLADGTVRSAQRSNCRSTADYPASDDDIINKFLANSNRAIDAPGASELVELVLTGSAEPVNGRLLELLGSR